MDVNYSMVYTAKIENWPQGLSTGYSNKSLQSPMQILSLTCPKQTYFIHEENKDVVTENANYKCYTLYDPCFAINTSSIYENAGM